MNAAIALRTRSSRVIANRAEANSGLRLTYGSRGSTPFRRDPQNQSLRQASTLEVLEQPVRRLLRFLPGQCVGAVLPVERHLCPSFYEQSGQPLRLSQGNNLVEPPGRYEDGHSFQAGQLLRRQGHHRPEQQRARGEERPRQQHACGDVRSVRVSDKHYWLRFETIPDRRSLHEIRALLRAELQVLDVEYAFRQPSEEAGHAVLYHLPSRTE